MSAIINTPVARDLSNVDPATGRDALSAQSRTVGFFDDFGRTDLYSENDTITHMVSTPETGSAWRLAAAGAGAAPKVVSGTYRAAGTDKLFYLGSSTPTSSGRLQLGFVYSAIPTQYVTGAYSTNTHNITFNSTQILPDGGGIVPEGAVHINFNIYGVASCDFYGSGGSTAIPCVNASYAGGLGAYPWNSAQVEMASNAPHTLMLEVEGDFLYITLVGVGTLIFYHADISSKVGATTFFWWESGAETYDSTNYRYIAALHRVFCSAEEKAQNPFCGAFYGGNIASVMSGGPHKLPGQLRLYPRNQASYQSITTPPNASTAGLIAAGRTTTSPGGGLSRASGGDVITEGLFIMNQGYTGVGAAVPAFAPGSVDAALDAKLSSAGTGSETNLVGDIGVLAGLNNGDWEEWHLAGELVGTNAKRIRINAASAGDIIDSNPSSTFTAAVSDTITTAAAHFWRTGDVVQVSSTGTLPAGISAATDYFIIRLTATTLKFATSRANAFAGTAVDITDTGTGTHTLASTFLNSEVGFWECDIRRHVLNGASHTWFATIRVNGNPVAAKRLVWNGTTTYNALAFKTTTADAGGVTVEHLGRTIHRVNVT